MIPGREVDIEEVHHAHLIKCCDNRCNQPCRLRGMRGRIRTVKSQVAAGRSGSTGNQAHGRTKGRQLTQVQARRDSCGLQIPTGMRCICHPRMSRGERNPMKAPIFRRPPETSISPHFCTPETGDRTLVKKSAFFFCHFSDHFSSVFLRTSRFSSIFPSIFPAILIMLSFGFAFGSFVPFHLCFRFFTQTDPEAFWPHEGVLFMMKQESNVAGYLMLNARRS